MELKKFISEVLSQIVDGVMEAQKSSLEKGAMIVPEADGGNIKNATYNPSKESANFYVQNVSFEVGLTIDSKEQCTNGIGVFLGSIGIGNKSSSSDENLYVTKVKFDIPIVLPPYTDSSINMLKRLKFIQ